MLGEEEEHDSVIESADASAFYTVPIYAGDIARGYVFIMLVSLFDYSAVACFDWNLLNIFALLPQIHHDQGKALQCPQGFCFQIGKAWRRKVSLYNHRHLHWKKVRRHALFHPKSYHPHR